MVRHPFAGPRIGKAWRGMVGALAVLPAFLPLLNAPSVNAVTRVQQQLPTLAPVMPPASPPNAVSLSGDAALEHLQAIGEYGGLLAAYRSSVGMAGVTGAAAFDWSQEAYLKASNTAPDAFFGRAVAISGATVVIGAPYEKSGATGVNGDQADLSVDAAGAAYVFVHRDGAWTQEAYLKPHNTGTNDQFGSAVAIDSDVIVVGAIREDSNADTVDGDAGDDSAQDAGAAYIFTRSGRNWTQAAYLKAANSDPDDQFGWSAAVSGDTVVVGAPFEASIATGVNGDANNNAANGAGAAYIFTRSGASWVQTAYLKAANAKATDNFGWAVAIDGNTVVAGAPFESSAATGVNGDASDDSAFAAGAAYVFTQTGGSWVQEAYLKASNPDIGDEFGAAVAVRGDTIVVGAYAEDSSAGRVNGDQNDNSLRSAGAAYVFARSSGDWAQTAYLKASNPGDSDQFGLAVGVDGDTVVVGGRSADADAIGGNGNDESLLDSGAVYVFGTVGGSWTQTAYLKATQPTEGVGLGMAVGVDAGRIVAGAQFDDSGATGVNGDPNDKSSEYAGAAHIFGPALSPIFVPMQVTISGSGAVTSNPAGIDCGITCTVEFLFGTPVTLTATAGVTSTFLGWMGSCTGAGPCTVTMDAAKAVTATFGVQSNPITATLSSLFVGDLITYTVVATNTGTVPQQLTIDGSLPVDSDLVSSNGGPLQQGGAFGAGYIRLAGGDAGPGQSVTLIWVVRMRDLAGDIEASAAVTNGTLNLTFNAGNKIYRVFLMGVFKDGSW